MDHIPVPKEHIGIPKDHIPAPKEHIGISKDHIPAPMEHIGIPKDHILILKEHIGTSKDHIPSSKDQIGISKDHIPAPMEHIGTYGDHIPIPIEIRSALFQVLQTFKEHQDLILDKISKFIDLRLIFPLLIKSFYIFHNLSFCFNASIYMLQCKSVL